MTVIEVTVISFSVKHAILSSKSKYWFALNLYNISGVGHVYPHIYSVSYRVHKNPTKHA